MPYLHQVRVDSGRTLSMRIPIPLTESTLKKVYDIHSKIYKGDQIDRKTFPIFLQNKWGDDRSMRFFLSTEYNFKTKKWISGGKIIPDHAWAKSKQHDSCYMNFDFRSSRTKFCFFKTNIIGTIWKKGNRNHSKRIYSESLSFRRMIQIMLKSDLVFTFARMRVPTLHT